MSLTVLQPGTQTLIMDAGRAGHRHQGLPQSGAADPLSFAISNHLVGNKWDSPALEIALGGVHIRFHQDCWIALSGAQMMAQNQGLNLPLNKAVKVEAGDILTTSFTRAGCRAYLAVAGGLKATRFLGSVATYPPAKLGGLSGTALKTGDIVEFGPVQAPPNELPPAYIPRLSNHAVLRARAGPEWGVISAEGQRYIFTTPFYATEQTSRMGARLKGDHIALETPQGITSSGLLPGTLQIPPSGQPILTLIDGHCTGGYARALQIIQADLWLLGQIAPGTAISFRRAFDGEASTILQCRNQIYSGLIPGFTF